MNDSSVEVMKQGRQAAGLGSAEVVVQLRNVLVEQKQGVVEVKLLTLLTASIQREPEQREELSDQYTLPSTRLAYSDWNFKHFHPAARKLS